MVWSLLPRLAQTIWTHFERTILKEFKIDWLAWFDRVGYSNWMTDVGMVILGQYLLLFTEDKGLFATAFGISVLFPLYSY